MTTDECIKQLESLRAHCDYMYDDKWDSDDIWDKDVEALDMAIDLMKANAGIGFVCVLDGLSDYRANKFPDVAPAPEIEWLPEPPEDSSAD